MLLNQRQSLDEVKVPITVSQYVVFDQSLRLRARFLCNDMTWISHGCVSVPELRQ
jgi:hypothetical protein